MQINNGHFFTIKKTGIMKKISLIIALFIFTTLAIVQAPDFINYKNVHRDAEGIIISNESISGPIVISVGS